MRRIAIIGSGITGLAAAHGLLQAGFDVTVYSDRTAEEWLNESRPTRLLDSSWHFPMSVSSV